MSKKKAIRAPGKVQTYESFLGSVKLHALSLDEMSAKLNRDLYWKHLKRSENITRAIEATYKPVNLEGDRFDIEARLTLTIALRGSSDEILTINCIYSAHFHAVLGFGIEAVEQFAKSGAKIIVWPYFRHFVSDMTSRMHIPPITIPLTLD